MEIESSYLKQKRLYYKIIRCFSLSFGSKGRLSRTEPNQGQTKVNDLVRRPSLELPPRHSQPLLLLDSRCPHCYNKYTNCPSVFVSLFHGPDFWAGSPDSLTTITRPCSSCLSSGRTVWLLTGLPTRFIQWGSFQIDREFKCGIAQKKDKCLLHSDIVTIIIIVICNVSNQASELV